MPGTFPGMIELDDVPVFVILTHTVTFYTLEPAGIRFWSIRKYCWELYTLLITTLPCPLFKDLQFCAEAIRFYIPFIRFCLYYCLYCISPV